MFSQDLKVHSNAKYLEHKSWDIFQHFIYLCICIFNFETRENFYAFGDARRPYSAQNNFSLAFSFEIFKIVDSNNKRF